MKKQNKTKSRTLKGKFCLYFAIVVNDVDEHSWWLEWFSGLGPTFIIVSPSLCFCFFFGGGVPQGSIFVPFSLCLLCLSCSLQANLLLSQHTYLQWKFPPQSLLQPHPIISETASTFWPSLRSLPNCLSSHIGSAHFFWTGINLNCLWSFVFDPETPPAFCPSLASA